MKLQHQIAWFLEQSSGCNDFTCIHYLHKFITVSNFVLDAASMVLFSRVWVCKRSIGIPTYHVCEVVIGNQLLRTRQAAVPKPKFDKHMHSYFISPCKLFLSQFECFTKKFITNYVMKQYCKKGQPITKNGIATDVPC